MRTVLRALLLTACIAISSSVSATLVTVDFSVHGGTEGPLAGVTSNGVVTFDDHIIPTGGTGSGTADVLSMSFTWNGKFYDSTNAYQFLYFTAGQLTELGVGNDCSGGFCAIGFDTTQDTWMFRAGHFNDFMYAIPWDCQCWASVFSGTSEFSVRESVPEPGTLGLMGIALAGIPAIRRRFAKEPVSRSGTF